MKLLPLSSVVFRRNSRELVQLKFAETIVPPSGRDAQWLESHCPLRCEVTLPELRQCKQRSGSGLLRRRQIQCLRRSKDRCRLKRQFLRRRRCKGRQRRLSPSARGNRPTRLLPLQFPSLRRRPLQQRLQLALCQADRGCRSEKQTRSRPSNRRPTNPLWRYPGINSARRIWRSQSKIQPLRKSPPQTARRKRLLQPPRRRMLSRR